MKDEQFNETNLCMYMYVYNIIWFLVYNVNHGRLQQRDSGAQYHRIFNKNNSLKQYINAIAGFVNRRCSCKIFKVQHARSGMSSLI